MNRVYLLPQIIIVTFILLYFYESLFWLHILLAIIISIFIVILYHFLKILLFGKYYLYQHQKGKNVPSNKIYHFIHRYVKLANRILRMKIDIKHLERFNPNKTYLITPNHQSNFDVIVLIETFKDLIIYVAKIAVSNFFIVKDYMVLFRCLYLNKDDLRGQIKVMQEVEEKLKQNESVIIFPEGKRSFSSEMDDFRPGTFRAATKTKVDILPITINRVYQIRHHFPWKKTYIEVYIHEPISYEEYKDMDTKEISKKIHGIVQSKVIS